MNRKVIALLVIIAVLLAALVLLTYANYSQGQDARQMIRLTEMRNAYETSVAK